MSSTVTKPMSDAGSNSVGFSYAQAAKGRMTATIPTVQPGDSTSGQVKPARTSADATGTPVNGTSSVVDLDQHPSLSENGSGSNGQSGSTPTNTQQATSVPPSLDSSPSSPSFGSASTSTLPKEDDFHSLPAHITDATWQRGTRMPSATDTPSENSERRKGKKSKKDKAVDSQAEKEKEETRPAEILVAAPPPTVNIWQQRKEAQASKAKPSAESPQNLTAETPINGSVSGATNKSTDSKQKTKSQNADEVDEATSSAQSTTSKEAAPSTKSQKKSAEGIPRPKDEATGRRSKPRGARLGEKEEKAVSSQLPPPVEDSISWPTPETALEEEKRKAQEKVEKEDKEEPSSTKQPRAKEKWVTVPYIPTVTFNTPLPARGGRARGGTRGGREGGRSGHVTNGSISTDRTSATTDIRDRGRDSGNSGRATSLPPNASKRSGAEVAVSSRDQRKPSASTLIEKPKTELSGASIKSDSNSAAEARRQSVAAQADSSQNQSPALEGSTKNEQNNGTASIPGTQSRSSTTGDRRGESSVRGADQSRDGNVHGQSRERGEGRPDRGRGGSYRGTRGGHNNFSNGQQHAQHGLSNGHVQSPTGFGMRSNSGSFTSPTLQQPYNTTYTPQSSRGGRGGPPRSQSIPNNNMYGRFSHPVGNTAGAQPMAPLQTNGPYDYTGQTMSAMPFNPYVDQYSVLAMVTMQLEYYFSIDNLCKDVYLRKHMDSQGFVFLNIIAGFKRIQSLTKDIELLRFACQESEVIEIVTGEDGIDRLRRQNGWEKWIVPLEDREESARNAGPERFYRQSSYQRSQSMQMPRMHAPGYQALSPPAFSPNGAEFQPYVAAQPIPVANGLVNGDHLQPNESPLSATVPDFAPSQPILNLAEYGDVEVTFTDEEVDNLNLVYTQKGIGNAKPTVPYHNASSRTFSNGSIDGRSLSEELQEPQNGANHTATNDTPAGNRSPDSLRRSRSPFTSLSSNQPLFENPPPVMWVKGQKTQAPVSDSDKNEPYSAVRARALRNRQASTVPGEVDADMKLLYEFWSHFLVRNFNPRMYEEFRTCALEDAGQKQLMFGMANLVAYYDEVLNSKKRTIPEVLARHYVDLVKAEDPLKERPGFVKLRTAWRNGALDMKSRKKVDNLVDAKLREELER